MNEFKEGDVVQLKSGGPRMTVTKISGEQCRCKWFDQNNPKSSLFEASILQKYKAEGSVSLGPKMPEKF
jgi:uncharacterized protein YodC (DUF2158 family)